MELADMAYSQIIRTELVHGDFISLNGAMEAMILPDQPAGFATQYFIEIARDHSGAPSGMLALAAKKNCATYGIPSACSMASVLGAEVDRARAQAQANGNQQDARDQHRQEQSSPPDEEAKSAADEEARPEDEDMQAATPSPYDAVMQGLRNGGLLNGRLGGQSAATAGGTRFPAMASSRIAPSYDGAASSFTSLGGASVSSDCQQYVDQAKAGSMSASYKAAACLQAGSVMQSPSSPGAAEMGGLANQNYGVVRWLQSK
jgi:hypothetical protein